MILENEVEKSDFFIVRRVSAFGLKFPFKSKFTYNLNSPFSESPGAVRTYK